MADIVLATLNARYIHTALGLRYLLANLGALSGRATLLEFTLQQRPIDIAEMLLRESPRVLGLGVYLWNVREITELVALLKQIAPELPIILGGPEVSHETEGQPLARIADYVIQGPGEQVLGPLCEQILAGHPPSERIIAAPPTLPEHLPYHLYRDEDIAHRVIYVEASRGCPFRCEFCLSALDRTALPFPLEPFLAAMADLWRRGARQFKFVDRTFNLNIRACEQILDFFLERVDERTFLHFELIPDRLPEALKTRIERFPPGALQFEIGVQTFTPDVQARIDRRQDNAQTEANLRYLRQHAHLHTDLILGLPGDSLTTLAASFDRLVALQPQEIQVGILKRLNGASIIRHQKAFALRFDPAPPYAILATRDLDFATMQRLNRFARYWDLIANSGRFPHAVPVILGDSPFARFLALSDWIHAQTGQTHRFALERLFEWVHAAAIRALGESPERITAALQADYARSGLKKAPAFLRPKTSFPPRRDNALARQARHHPGSACK